MRTRPAGPGIRRAASSALRPIGSSTPAASRRPRRAWRPCAVTSLDVRMRLDSVAQKQEPAPSTAPESIYTKAAVHSLPPAIEQVVALNMTQERSPPEHALSTYLERAHAAYAGTARPTCPSPCRTRLRTPPAHACVAGLGYIRQRDRVAQEGDGRAPRDVVKGLHMPVSSRLMRLRSDDH
jgi:hypothetical protein